MLNHTRHANERTMLHLHIETTTHMGGPSLVPPPKALLSSVGVIMSNCMGVSSRSASAEDCVLEEEEEGGGGGGWAALDGSLLKQNTTKHELDILPHNATPRNASTTPLRAYLPAR